MSDDRNLHMHVRICSNVLATRAGGFAKPSSDFYVFYSTTTAPGCHRNGAQYGVQHKSKAALRPARIIASRSDKARQKIDSEQTLPGKVECQGRRTVLKQPPAACVRQNIDQFPGLKSRFQFIPEWCAEQIRMVFQKHRLPPRRKPQPRVELFRKYLIVTHRKPRFSGKLVVL